MTPGRVVVQKYGGACLATPERVRTVAASVAGLYRAGQKPVVVVSAMGSATDELIRLAYRVSPTPNRRELDMLLSTGERVSMALVSMALADLGIPAISFTGSQAGVLTDDSHAQARIHDVRPHRVEEELARGRAVVLAGFQGVNARTREITTLGRGGSDTTAVAMAAALGAERCEIIKEVDGVCTADPRVAPGARPIARLDFATLMEMCFWGAKVLHYRSVELAARRDLDLVLKRWERAGDTTRVTREVHGMETGAVVSINSLKNVEHVGVVCTTLNEGFAKFGAHLERAGLGWPQILASAFDRGQLRLMATGDDESVSALVRSLERQADFCRLRPKMSAVAVTCWGAVASDLTAKVVNALGPAGITPEKILFNPQTLSVLVPPERREDAIRALHGLIEPPPVKD